MSALPQRAGVVGRAVPLRMAAELPVRPAVRTVEWEGHGKTMRWERVVDEDDGTPVLRCTVEAEGGVPGSPTGVQRRRVVMDVSAVKLVEGMLALNLIRAVDFEAKSKGKK